MLWGPVRSIRWPVEAIRRDSARGFQLDDQLPRDAQQFGMLRMSCRSGACDQLFLDDAKPLDGPPELEPLDSHRGDDA